MSGKHLLDTNIIIAIFRSDAKVIQQLASSPDTYVPVIALGELYFGAEHSSNVQRNLAQVRAFAAQSKVLLCDPATAEVYGQVKNELKLQGHPIPENDVWIAALAKQHGLTVVSRDQHFLQVTGLSVAVW
jgi:tRNA(fMet)-specific endonuclease VapC